jgi:hypothetical protein
MQPPYDSYLAAIFTDATVMVVPFTSPVIVAILPASLSSSVLSLSLAFSV